MKKEKNSHPADEYNGVAEVLRREDSFLLVSHINPDGDSIGSLAAMSLLLSRLEKEHLIYLHDEAPERYRFLLTGLPVTRDAAAAGNRVVLALDSSDPARLGQLQGLAGDGSYLVNIDHHVSNTGYGRISLVDTRAAATGEIIYRLARLLQVEISTKMAEALYTSISTDTGSFKYDGTTEETFRIMADLLGTGFSLRKLSLKLFDEMSPSGLCLLRAGLQSMVFTAENKIASMTVTDAVLAACRAGEEHLDGLVNYAVNVKGVEVGLLFRVKESGEIKVGFRSKRVDVSKIAGSLGGGGHKKAAGCTIKGSLKEARAKVLVRVAKAVYDKDRA